MRYLFLLALCCSILPAATIDVDFAKVRGSSMGAALSAALAPAAPAAPAAQATGEVVSAAPAADVAAVPAADPLARCTRVLVTWAGPNDPPVVRFLGIDGEAYCQGLAQAGAATIDTKYGPAYPLPTQKGFAVVPLGADELLMAPPALLATVDAPAWPEATATVIRFTGPATDLKLGDLQDELKEFALAWEHTGDVSLRAVANSSGDAKAVLRYISLRSPLLDAAAALGIDKAVFPAKLLDAAEINREGNVILAKLTLDEPTRNEAVDYLAKQLRRQLRKYK